MAVDANLIDLSNRKLWRQFFPKKNEKEDVVEIILVEVCWKEWVMKNEIKYWILDFGFCESGLLLKKHGSARRTATKPSGIFSCCF